MDRSRKKKMESLSSSGSIHFPAVETSTNRSPPIMFLGTSGARAPINRRIKLFLPPFYPLSCGILFFPRFNVDVSRRRCSTRTDKLPLLPPLRIWKQTRTLPVFPSPFYFRSFTLLSCVSFYRYATVAN